MPLEWLLLLLCPTLSDSMNCSMPGFSVLYINQTLLKFMLFESVMLSNHLILCHPLFLLSSIFLRIRIIRVVSSAYLRLLIFLLEILIQACDSSSVTFHMMYSAYKLNKQGDNIQYFSYTFPNLEPVNYSMSGSHCCFLTLTGFSGDR